MQEANHIASSSERPRQAPVTDFNWPVLATVGLGTFMSALDGSIVNTLLPILTRALRSHVSVTEWIITVYLLVVSGLLLSVGRWGDLHGQKRAYLCGFGLFGLGSALCGLSPSAGALIGARALQAAGASMLFASGPAILTNSFPAARRGQALGMQATMTYLGLTAGPLFGGWMATHIGWRSVFAVNVPASALAYAMAARAVPPDTNAVAERRFDVAGAVLFALGLVSLLLVLNLGGERGWRSATVCSLAATALFALSVFLVVETRLAEPMLDLSLFRNRIFAASTAAALLNYLSLNCVLFVLPFYLIQGRGYGADSAGALLTAQPIVMAVAAPLSGLLSDRIGTRTPATIGMALLATGIFMMVRLHATSAPHDIAAALAVTGLGTGIFISPNNSALLGSAPRKHRGVASGVLATARNVGMVLGVGLSGAVYLSTLGPEPHSGNAVFRAAHSSFLVGCAAALAGTAAALLRGNGEAKH